MIIQLRTQAGSSIARESGSSNLNSYWCLLLTRYIFYNFAFSGWTGYMAKNRHLSTHKVAYAVVKRIVHEGQSSLLTWMLREAINAMDEDKKIGKWLHLNTFGMSSSIIQKGSHNLWAIIKHCDRRREGSTIDKNYGLPIISWLVTTSTKDCIYRGARRSEASAALVLTVCVGKEKL